ncbi:DoxX family protein [Streptomyces bauhiniae]|uniref:DoxX family protein n=1 Tax=Streptomyces bauhiniae TaxID=2340725 RepID=UPI0038072985
MDLALWISAWTLAGVALVGGVSKTSCRRRSWPPRMGGWTDGVGARSVKALGVLELLAAAGLVLPALLDRVPVLVPVTAACWVLLMIGAMLTHGRRREFGFVVLNLAYLALAAFIAWRRFGPEPFTG